MGTDIEKLIDLMIQERMQNQFAKWRKAETDKEKKADYLHLETEYEKAISALSEEQKEAVRHYCDSIFDSGTESECFFYRLGLKDGIRLWKFKADENGQLTDVQPHILFRPQMGRKPSNGTGWAAFSLLALLLWGHIIRLWFGFAPHIIWVFKQFGQVQYPQKSRKVLG